MGIILAILTFLFLAAPAMAQYTEEVMESPWQDMPAASPAPKKIAALPVSQRPMQRSAAQASAAQSSGAAQGSNSGYRNSLPPTATSCVNLSICEAPPREPAGAYNNGGNGGNDTSNLPPSPGEGYQPIFQHGVFVGYMSPELISLMQSDARAAWTAFARSSDFVGPDGLRLSLLAETGAATPEEMAALYQKALFGI